LPRALGFPVWIFRRLIRQQVWKRQEFDIPVCGSIVLIHFAIAVNQIEVTVLTGC
jgi:hypothetical protein